MKSLDHQIADAERAVTDAIRRRDTRGSHHAINHLRAAHQAPAPREPLEIHPARGSARWAGSPPRWRCSLSPPRSTRSPTSRRRRPRQSPQARAHSRSALWGLLILILCLIYVRAMNAMERTDNDERSE